MRMPRAHVVVLFGEGIAATATSAAALSATPRVSKAHVSGPAAQMRRRAWLKRACLLAVEPRRAPSATRGKMDLPNWWVVVWMKRVPATLEESDGLYGFDSRRRGEDLSRREDLAAEVQGSGRRHYCTKTALCHRRLHVTVFILKHPCT